MPPSAGDVTEFATPVRLNRRVGETETGVCKRGGYAKKVVPKNRRKGAIIFLDAACRPR